MKRHFLFLMAALLTGCVTLCMSSCSSDDNPNSEITVQDWSKKKAKYTIMVYGCGGGDIDHQLENGLKQIQQALGASNNQVRYTIMYSMSKNGLQNSAGNNYLGDWHTTYRYEMTPQTDLTVSGYRSKYKYKDASEVELYKASTLAEFINWSKQTAPAENYILLPINHGGGFDLNMEFTRSIAYDDNHDDKAIATKTIADAIKSTNTHLKAIYWYGCLLGSAEVLTETAEVCDYQFASSHSALTFTPHLYSIINAINSYPDDFEAAAKAEGALLNQDGAFEKWYTDVPDPNDKTKMVNVNGDFGCWKSSKLAAINDQVNRLATLLSSKYETNKDEIDNATKNVYMYNTHCKYVDLQDYAYKVAKYLDGGNNQEAKDILAKTEQAINDAYLYRISAVNLMSLNGIPVATYNKKFSLNISLYHNTEPSYNRYGQSLKDSKFNAATNWTSWLDKNEKEVQENVNPCNSSVWNNKWLNDPE